MSKYWNELTASLVPYVPGEQPKDQQYIKLNTNENPYPPSPKVLEAIRNATNADLRLYPDPNCDQLREALAGYYRLSKEQAFVGNGSDEILAFAFQAFFSASKTILFPDITYTFYPVYADLYGLNYETIPTDDEFNIDAERFCVPNGGIIIPNPNAPTARFMVVDQLKIILDANPDQVVIVDEAYIDFGGESVVSWVKEYPNLLVVQTLSKSRSLAGLRVGMAFGHPDLIEGLNRVKNSFNSYTLDRLALAGAVAAIKDQSYFEETNRKVIATRERTSEELKRLGFRVIESKANFVFISHERLPASEIFSTLKRRGILVRYFNKPRINEYLRVSIGTDEEMDALVSALTEIVQPS
ncbi:histidinol-phosphate transaminase [Cohnella cholangitidis]|uniref:Histidinol-phosphate aminotransferase n=1 Tax=Cohnella cholangitidis TaxID=2598458 RepID=A0A7G5C645_9BACL|nr:histidinol-phosphate transaminase [Cohnella cholangitidis]QMV44679.1 histidinol-phosphate transaminase [Cohnella cholangitidis]